MTNICGRRVVLALALCGALGSVFVRGQQAAGLTVVKLADDLYAFENETGPITGNSTVLVTDEGVLLVDDKFAVDHDRIMAALASITDKPIRYVVNTHHHADHSGGNVQMKRANIPVIASAQAREHMSGLPRDGLFIDAQPGLPNITFENHMDLDLGGKRVDLYQFGRAHTSGDVVVLFPSAHVLAAGDIFTFGDTTPQLIDYAGGGSAKEWTKTLDSALQLDFQTVVPGHGKVTTKQEMHNFRERTLSLRTEVQEMIRQKRTRDEIAGMLRTEYHWIPFLLDRSLDGLLGELQ